MLRFREVTMDDADNLLSWKNELDTRMNSIVSQDKIKRKDHLVWLKKTLADKTIDFYIIELGLPGKEFESIGDLRLNYSDTEVEVSIRMDKRFRGQGIATQVISMIGVTIQPRGHKPLVAKIVVHNLASMRVFIKNGYWPEEYYEAGFGHQMTGGLAAKCPAFYIFKRRYENFT